MTRRMKILIAGTLAAGVVGGGAAIGAASIGGDDVDTPITGPAYERATSAALAHVGEGAVAETEVGDEEGAYEVEVRLADGSHVDVHLTEGFEVIGTKAGTDGPEGTR